MMYKNVDIRVKLPSLSNQVNISKLSIWIILFFLAADTIYSSWHGINLQTRDKCVIYQFMPKWLFITYEYLIELFMVIVAGTFAGSVVEKYFTRYRWILPKNQFSAFLYASIIPVCSCSAIPFIESMKKKLPLRTIISFITAAPILNPYVIFLSFSLLGFRYGTLRIIGSFVVSVMTGIIVQLAYNIMGKPEIGIYKNCSSKTCSTAAGQDVYQKTWKMIAAISPYILIAGFLGLLLEITGPIKFLEQLPLNDGFVSLLTVTLIGTFVYLCNGADVLFLAPLLAYTDLGLGNAIAFSITSTAVCATSIVMLFKFLGKKLTLILVASIYLTTLLFSILI